MSGGHQCKYFFSEKHHSTFGNTCLWWSRRMFFSLFLEGKNTCWIFFRQGQFLVQTSQYYLYNNKVQITKFYAVEPCIQSFTLSTSDVKENWTLFRCWALCTSCHLPSLNTFSSSPRYSYKAGTISFSWQLNQPASCTNVRWPSIVLHSIAVWGTIS